MCTADQPVTPLEIQGDAGLEGRAVEHGGDLRITGNICHGAVVRAAGNITVRGTIECAQVYAGGALMCEGPVVGRGKGTYAAGGAFTCRSCNGARIEALDDLTIQIESVSSRLICGGFVRAASAHLSGGHITANGGLECNVLGTPGSAETVAELGLDEPLLALSHEQCPGIEADLRRAARIREQVEPLLNQQRALTPKQRETATELLFQADELREKTGARVSALRERLTASLARSKPAATVHSMIYPGAVLRFPAGEYRVNRLIRGPIRVELRGRGAASSLVLIHLESSAEEPLAFQRSGNARFTALLRVLALHREREAAAAARTQAA